MKKNLILVGIVLVFGLVGLVGCGPQNDGKDPSPAKEGEFKTPDQVPGKEGRQRAEEGGGR